VTGVAIDDWDSWLERCFRSGVLHCVALKAAAVPVAFSGVSQIVALCIPIVHLTGTTPVVGPAAAVGPSFFSTAPLAGGADVGIALQTTECGFKAVLDLAAASDGGAERYPTVVVTVERIAARLGPPD
jgi:hypothetical protein